MTMGSGRGREQTESLTGIETYLLGNKMHKLADLGREQTESLTGIETTHWFTGPAPVTRREQTESLTGIETYGY